MAKEKLEMSSDERDLNQRQYGFFGLSGLLHAGVLLAIFLAPSFRTMQGAANGTEAALSMNDTAQAAGEASVSGVTSASAGAPHEVLLADAGDAKTVELPDQAAPQAATAAAPAPAPKPATATATAPASTTTAPVETTKVAASAPAPSEVAKPVKQAQAKFEAAAATKVESPSDAGDIAEAEKADMKPVAQESAAEESDSTPTNTSESSESAPADSKTAEADSEETTSATTAAAPETTNSGTKDDAVPVQVALPESEALTEKQEAELQAPPSAKTAKNEIPSSATPIETVSAMRSSGSGSVAGSGSSAGSTSAGTNSAGQANGGAGSVPLGVPVRDARSLIAMPGNKAPTYPLADRLANKQGTAVLVAKVTNAGTVENVALEQSSGSRTLDQSAAQAFKSWRYKPGQEGYIRQPMKFQLAGNVQEVPAQLQRQ